MDEYQDMLSPTQLRSIADGVANQNSDSELLSRVFKASLNTEWNADMDAAPTNCRRLLLYVPRFGPSTGHFDGRWHCHSVLDKDVQPTHWMELPPSPDLSDNLLETKP